MSTETYVEVRCRSGSQEGLCLSFVNPTYAPMPVPLLVGRGSDAHLRFCGDDEQMVSRSHAEISPAGDGLLICDVGSSCGTWLGERREPIRRTDLPVGTCVDIQFGTSGPVCSVSVGIAVPFGRYLLTGKLGEGGMGEVYVGWDPQLARSVVLKLIRPSFMQQEQGAGRYLLDEARILSQLDHPNTVRIYEVGEESGIVYIAMEYLRGVTLGQILHAHTERGLRLPPQIAAGLMRHACLGLHAAHEVPSAIVHRDVSMGNVMVTRDGLKVIDFGLARAKNRISPSFTEGGRIAGSPPYMSPEQVRAPKTLDRRTDVYSAAVVLYELCSGVNPFQRENLAATLNAVLSYEPPPVSERCPEAPPELVQILRCAMSKDPAQRPGTALELAVALRHAAGPHYAHFETLTPYLRQMRIELCGQPPEPLTRVPQLIEQARTRHGLAASRPASLEAQVPPAAPSIVAQPMVPLARYLERPIAQGRYVVVTGAGREPPEPATAPWQRAYVAKRRDGERVTEEKVLLTLVGGRERAYGLSDRDAATLFQAVASRRGAGEADGIPPILDQGLAWPEGPCFVVTPYYERRLDSVPPRTLAAAAVLDLLRQGADALHRAAQREPGLVHGALCPEQVGLTQREGSTSHAVLTGWPWLATDGEDGGAPLAPIPYRAPELKTRRDATTASDVFALGMIAYGLLGGDAGLAWKQIGEELDPDELPARARAELPPSVACLLMDCLRGDPAMRPRPSDIVDVLTRAGAAQPGPEPGRPVVEVPGAGRSFWLETAALRVSVSTLDLPLRELREPIPLPIELPGLQRGVDRPLRLMATGQICELRVSPEALDAGRQIRIYTEPTSAQARNAFIVPMAVPPTNLYVGHHRGHMHLCSLASAAVLPGGSAALRLQPADLGVTVVARPGVARLLTLHWIDTQRGDAHLLCITLS